jgi:hypothetical protein
MALQPFALRFSKRVFGVFRDSRALETGWGERFETL